MPAMALLKCFLDTMKSKNLVTTILRDWKVLVDTLATIWVPCAVENLTCNFILESSDHSSMSGSAPALGLRW